MDENKLVLQSLLKARDEHTPCVLATVIATTGSIPRAAGAKMLVHFDSKIVGTVGGGKFESLVIVDALAAMREKTPDMKTYPLHEGDANSFGAICGGEVTVLLEPQALGEAANSELAGAIGAMAGEATDRGDTGDADQRTTATRNK